MSTPNVPTPTKRAAQVAGQNPASAPKTVASTSSKTTVGADAKLPSHVCTDACTHEGAAKGASAPVNTKGSATPAPTAAKVGEGATHKGS